MLPFVLAANEMRRLWARKLVRVALVATLLVPVLYGAFYLYANWDPFSRLDRLPAALVVAPSTGDGFPSGTDDSGTAVAHRLVDTGTFDWTLVDADQASAGVTDGTYAFALTLPASFTSSAYTADTGDTSTGAKDDKNLLVLTTGDAGNYVDSVVANRVVEEVHTAVAAEAGQGTADELLLGYQTIAQQAKKAAASASDIVTSATGVKTSAAALTQQVTALGTTQADLVSRVAAFDSRVGDAQQNLQDVTARASDISSNVGDVEDRASPLPGQAATIASGARSVASDLGDVVDGIPPEADGVLTTYDSVEPQILALGLTTDQVASVEAIIATARGQMASSLGDIKSRAAGAATARTLAGTVAGQADSLGSAAGGVRDAASTADDGVSDLQSQARSLGGDLTALDSAATTVATEQQSAATATSDLGKKTASLGTAAGTVVTASQQLQSDLQTDEQSAGSVTPGSGTDVAASPLAVRTTDTAGGGAYGVGLTPFLLAIATWIGAFVLFLLIRPLSTRALAARMPAWRVALGGWLPGAVLGVVQIALMLVVVVFGLGVRPAQPLALIGFLTLVSLAFTATLHALNAAFGRTGTLLGLLLLVLQLATAGGAFPWQTLPPALVPLHLLLPMGYVVDGLRALMYGQDLAVAGVDFAVLGGYLVAGLLISTLAARSRQRWTPARLVPTLVV